MSQVSKKKKSVWWLVLICLIACLGYWSLIHFSSTIAKEVLKELFQEKSVGKYTLGFTDLEVSILNSRLDIIELRIDPIEAPDSRLDSTKKEVYFVRIPTVQISLKSISDIFFHKTLSFEHISVTNPSIRMERLSEGVRQQSFSLEAGDLYKIIDDYLIEFSVDSLGINQASMDYESKIKGKESKILINQIDLILKNFEIDSTSEDGQFLLTGGFSLHLTDQSFLLRDSLHIASFDKFSLSTSMEQIVIDNFSLQQRSDKTYQSDSDLNRYDIQLPKTYFRGLDFEKAYESDALILKDVLIKNPQVKVEQKQTTKKSSNSIPLLISRLFNSVSIQKLKIENATTSIKIDHGLKNQSFLFEESNLEIDGFYLDSATYYSENRNDLFDHIKLSSQRNAVLLPDSSHLISFQEIFLSSHDSSFLVNNLSITPLEVQGIQDVISASVAKINIAGLDYQNLANLQDIKIGQLNVIEPNVTIKSNKIRDNDQSSFDLLESIAIDDLDIINGMISISSPSYSYDTKQANVAVTHIKWDFSEPQELISSFDLIRLSAIENSITTDKARIQIQNIDASDQWQTINLSDIKAKLATQPYPLSISSASISGLDMLRLLSQQFIEFDTLKIIQPNITFVENNNPDNSRLIRQLHHMRFDNISTYKANVTLLESDSTQLLRLHGFTGNLSKFAYDSLFDEYYVDPVVHIDSVQFHFKQMDHLLKGTDLRFDAIDSLISLSSIRFKPRVINDAKNAYDILSDSLLLAGIDIHTLINGKLLNFESGQLRNPKINLSLKVDKPNDNKIPIVFQNFHVYNAALELSQGADKLGLSSHFDLDITGFNGESKSPLMSERYELIGDHLSIKVNTDWEDSIKASSYTIDSKSGNVSLSGLIMTQPNSFQTYVETLHLSGFDFDSALISKAFYLDTLTISKPEVIVDLTKNQNTQGSNNRLPTIQVRHIRVNNAEIDVVFNHNDEEDTIDLNEINLLADEINYHTDSTFKPLEIAQRLSFDGVNFAHELPGDKFLLRAKKYSFDSKNEELSIRRFILEPRYNRGEFQSLLTYQATWIDAEVQQLSLSGISLELLLKGEVAIKKVLVEDLILNTHRDKRLPREPNLYKPLPQKALQSLPFVLTLDSIGISDAFVSHSEFSQDGIAPGVIFFRNLDGSVTNITNKPSSKERDSLMVFNVSGRIMNTGGIDIKSVFDYNDSLNAYTLEGRVGDMELTELNTFLENTQSVLIRGGKNRSLSFSLEANENFAFGKMRFYYRDLKLTVLDKDTHERRGHGAGIKTFFANTFVVSSKNPNFFFLRKGYIFTERDKEKSVFAYWGSSIVSGLVSSIGAKNNLKEIKAHSQQIKNQMEIEETK